MKYEAHGHVYWIGQTEEKGQSRFRVREFVIETDGKFAQKVKFQATRDKCDELDSLSVGEPILVHFNIRGREWNPNGDDPKFFTSLEAWRLESTEHPGDRDERLQRNAHMQNELSKLRELDERGEAFDDSDIPF